MFLPDTVVPLTFALVLPYPAHRRGQQNMLSLKSMVFLQQYQRRLRTAKLREKLEGDWCRREKATPGQLQGPCSPSVERSNFSGFESFRHCFVALARMMYHPRHRSMLVEAHMLAYAVRLVRMSNTYDIHVWLTGR